MGESWIDPELVDDVAVAPTTAPRRGGEWDEVFAEHRIEVAMAAAEQVSAHALSGPAHLEARRGPSRFAR